MTELIYCGLILEDDATVESTGLKNGSMVHVLKKKRSETPAPTKHVSEESILQLTTAFKSFNDTPAYRSALHVIILITIYCYFIYFHCISLYRKLLYLRMSRLAFK